MGKQARPRPQCLAAKLLAIRQRLGVSQSEMVRLLNARFTSTRISEYESGLREPNLLTILAYSRAAGVPVEKIIDDELTI
jgi:transcriptional regulator with XRE-family HTH domain